MDGAGAGLDLSVQVGWGGMEGLQQGMPVPIRIPFSFFPSPLVPGPSLLPLPSALCLPAVPSMSSPCSLIVLPDVPGSTDPNEGTRCHHLCSVFLSPFPVLPGPHQLEGEIRGSPPPLGTGQDRTSVPLPCCLPSALSHTGDGPTGWGAAGHSHHLPPPRVLLIPVPCCRVAGSSRAKSNRDKNPFMKVELIDTARPPGNR